MNLLNNQKKKRGKPGPKPRGIISKQVRITLAPEEYDALKKNAESAGIYKLATFAYSQLKRGGHLDDKQINKNQ